MRKFNEFVNYNDIKLLIMNILDPQKILDQDNILTMQLDDFETSDKLLTSPELNSIIRKSSNRGAIEAALKNNSTTIGNLLSMLSEE